MVVRQPSQFRNRATRFNLRLPVYFRQPDSPTWLEGTTENVSYTGMLFRSASPIAPATTLELRLRLATAAQGTESTEMHGKGSVVRVEQRDLAETPVALAIAISFHRIVRRHLAGSGLAEDA